MKQNLKFKTVFTFVFASVFMFLACINIFAIDPQQKKSQVNIPIAMALDDGYTYPTIVSITSIMENAFDNLSIIHCICKPWNNPKVAFGRHWWDYARKTAFYKDICKKYPASRRK